MKRRILSIFLAVLFIMPIISNISLAETAELDNFKKVQTYTGSEFNDVKTEDWFSQDVASVYEMDLMSGRGKGVFAPTDNMIVAEAMTIATRLHSIYYTGKAVSGQSTPWYQFYADYCKNNNIVDPTNYELKTPITRGQFAEMFFNAFPAEALEEISAVQDDVLPDVKMNDPFSKAIYALYRAGVIVGQDSNGTFAPNSNIRRMEVAAITSRMAVASKRQKVSFVTQEVVNEPQEVSEEIKHTVTFDLGYDGKILETKEVLDGEKVVKPKSPTRSKYTFAGWYDKEKRGSKFDFDEEILSDVVIYAHWDKKNSGGGSSSTKKYTVTFDMNGVGSEIAPQTIIKGGKVTKPTDPTDINHTFAGWYTDSEYATEWNFETDTITADTTIYAKWTRTVKSILETNNEIPSSDSDNIPESAWVCNNGANLVLCKKLVNGDECLYIGSKNNDGIGYEMTDLSVLIDGNYVFAFESYGVLTCHMTEGKFTSADYDGTGTDYATLSGTYEPAVSVPVTGISLDLINATLEVGDNFTLHTTITPDNATNNNVTWSSSNETIVTVDNDGKITANAFGTAIITATTVDGSKTATCTVTVNELKTIEEIISTYKQDFPNSNETGWIESNSAHKMYYKDGTLYIDSDTIVDGADNALKDNGGYKYYDASQTIIFLIDGETLTSIQYSNEYNEQYDGIYIPVTTYTVTFDLNGQEGTAPDTQTIAENGKVIEPTPVPKATGYTFDGWYRDFSCDDAWDFDNDTVTEDTTLYAKWREWSTVADILETVEAFPSGEPEDHDITKIKCCWRNFPYNVCAIDEGYETASLVFKKGNNIKKIALTETLTKDGDNWKYVDDDITYEFNVTDYVLTSIEVSGDTTEGYQDVNGTYIETIVVYDILPDDFPNAEGLAWKNNDCFCCFDVSEIKFSDSEENYSDSVGELIELSESADNTFTCETTGGATVIFELTDKLAEGGVLESITVSGETGDKAVLNGIYSEQMCFAAGTPITLASGETELIENLKIGDEVRVFNHETGEVATSKLFELWKYPEKKRSALTLHFSNDIDLTVVGGHCFFSEKANKYVAVTKYNVDNYIGDRFYNVNEKRWETLESAEALDDFVDTYIVVTEKQINCVANGMLTSEDGIYDILINIFDYGENLKIDEVKKEADIEKYGLWDFENAQYISEDFYNALNLQYLSIVFGKGIITPEQFTSLCACTAEIDPDWICGTSQTEE